MSEYIVVLRKEELNSYENLLAQYKKELYDAQNKKGICKFMGEMERRVIANRLKESISSTEKAISELKKEISELENE